jgi:hypothetical protein
MKSPHEFRIASFIKGSDGVLNSPQIRTRGFF